METKFFLRRRLLGIPALLCAFVFFSGCANHLADGWKQYEKGQYLQAQAEWEKEKEKPLDELVAKAKAAQDVEQLYQQIVKAEEKKDHPQVIDSAKKMIPLDKWENKDWIEKSPNLKDYFKKGAASLESSTYEKMSKDFSQRKWQAVVDEYHAYQSFCQQYPKHCPAVSQRIKNLGEKAEIMLKKVKAAEKEFDANFSCGRKALLTEKYEESQRCFQQAIKIAKDVPEAEIPTDEAEYLLAAAEQSLEIQRALEEERRKAAEAERQRVEAELRRKAEAAAKIEAAKQAEEERRIQQARKAEAKRLRILAEKRRKEEKRKRELEERNRRWRAFLKKGSPLKPLVTTLGVPSTGRGKLGLKKRQKWQAGAQLPKPKNKKIKSKDIYALGISVPRQYKLTYLKNYHGSNRQNLLRPPKTQQGKRFYYTEDYKGGRYYTEVKNQRDRKGKYEIKSIIYKIPVTR